MNDQSPSPGSAPTQITESGPKADNTSSSAPKSPGRISHGAVTITLHSRHGYDLYHGRPGSSKQHAVIGLKTFARALDRMTDPDHFDRVEDELLDAQERIRQLNRQIDKAFEGNHLQSAQEGESLQPTVIERSFYNRLAHRGAQLLSEYDHAITRCLTLYSLGVHDRHQHKTMVRSLSQVVRKAYQAPVFTQQAVIDAKSSSSAEENDIKPSSTTEETSGDLD